MTSQMIFNLISILIYFKNISNESYLRAVIERFKSFLSLMEFLSEVFSLEELLLRFQREAILDWTSSLLENDAHEGVTPLDEFEDRLALLEPKLCDEREDESFDLMFDNKDFSLFLFPICLSSDLTGF